MIPGDGDTSRFIGVTCIVHPLYLSGVDLKMPKWDWGRGGAYWINMNIREINIITGYRGCTAPVHDILAPLMLCDCLPGNTKHWDVFPCVRTTLVKYRAIIIQITMFVH